MGRAVTPTRIRRQNGGPIEVLSASGFWTKQNLWSEGTTSNVHDACRKVGVDLWDLKTNWEDWEFDLTSCPDDDDVEEFANLTDLSRGPSDDQSDDANESNETQSSQTSEQQTSASESSQPPSIDDIVRRIAGQMDDLQAAALGEQLGAAMADALEQFKADYRHATSNIESVIPITVQVQVETPTATKTADGIFHNQFDKLVKLVAAGQHVYLPGPPGTGKSHAAEQVASVLGWRFASISLGPTTPESRLWGGMDAHGKFFEPPFVQLARYAAENTESGSVFCLDELDNGHAGVIATLNSAMANGWFTAPNGDVVAMGKNFTIVGAANTFGTGPTAEFAGRNKLDPATLDRFCYLPWDTDLGVEKALVHQLLDAASAKAWLDVWRTCRKNVMSSGLKVFVTMRGCVNGARLIASGIDPVEVLDMVLLNKLPEDQARKVKP